VGEGTLAASETLPYDYIKSAGLPCPVRTRSAPWSRWSCSLAKWCRW